MPKWWNNILSAFVGLLVGLFAMWCFQRCSVQPVEPIVIHDSISVPDTAALAAHTKPKYIVKWDTLYMPKDSSFVSEDSCSHKDTTPYVAIPITAYEYKDTFVTDTSSIELAVAFSGYNARIDSIGINYRFEVEPRVIREKKGFGWCVMPSVQVGYGVAFGSQVVAAPYIGVGVAVGWGYHW